MISPTQTMVPPEPARDPLMHPVQFSGDKLHHHALNDPLLSASIVRGSLPGVNTDYRAAEEPGE
jgi:hypothetical protein